MLTRYGKDVEGGKRVTRLRSPFVHRESEQLSQCRRWMQRGRSKSFNSRGVKYGKTYFSYNLKDLEGRGSRRTVCKKKANRRPPKHEVFDMSDDIEFEDPEASDEGEAEDGYAVPQVRKKHQPAVTNGALENNLQMYELYLEEDMRHCDENRRKQKKCPQPYFVICVVH